MIYIVTGITAKKAVEKVIEAKDEEYAKRLFTAMTGLKAFMCHEATVWNLYFFIRRLEVEANERVFNAVSETISHFPPPKKRGKRKKS